MIFDWKKIILLKLQYYPNWYTGLMWFPIKLPMTVFTVLEEIQKFTWTHKIPRVVKVILRVGVWGWGDRKQKPPRLQTILQSNSIQDSVILVQKQIYNQWNRINSPEINQHTYGQLIFQKEGKNIQWENDSLFIKWCWESWTAGFKSKELEHTLTLQK